MTATAFILVLSLVGLLVAADIFVDAVAELARRLDISPMVIGLTVVAVGTSLPEVAASAAASLKGHPEIALGNVIGSNIANIGLILGLPALYIPIVCTKNVVRSEGFLMVFLSIVLYVISFALGELNAVIGCLFLLSFALFIYWSFKRTREPDFAEELEEVAEIAEDALTLGTERVEKAQESEDADVSILRLSFRMFCSLAVVLVSSEYLVHATVELARSAGVSENVIAISLIAIGTSLPELSVSFAAARRKQGDILIGNVLGSNISNILLVLGVASMIKPVTMNVNTLNLDLPLMLVFAFILILFLSQSKGVNRPKGLVLLGLYGIVLWRCVAITP